MNFLLSSMALFNLMSERLHFVCNLDCGKKKKKKDFTFQIVVKCPAGKSRITRSKIIFSNKKKKRLYQEDKIIINKINQDPTL